MSDNQKKIIPINYTSRDFTSIKKDLLDIAERLYPDSFQDFSDAAFSSLMIDTVAYIGDQLSFYLDYNVNESFLDTAYQYNNILRHGKSLGFKFTGRPSTYGKAAIYLRIPATAVGLGIDRNYSPILKSGTQFKSSTGLNFTLVDNIDFSDPKLPIVPVATNANGSPTFYGVKAYGTVVSGVLLTETINVGSFEKFARITLGSQNVSEIISVFDSEGNEYFEVDYLAQDMVYREVSNSNFKNDNVPSILKPFLVSRKFTVERNNNNTILQFGSGKASDFNIVADPQSVAINVHGKTYTTSRSFDPTRLSQNESLGIVPENTTLTVTLRATNPGSSNISVGQLNEATSVLLDFKNRVNLSESVIDGIRASVEVNNESPITGDVSNATSDEIKQRIY